MTRHLFTNSILKLSRKDGTTRMYLFDFACSRQSWRYKELRDWVKYPPWKASKGPRPDRRLRRGSRRRFPASAGRWRRPVPRTFSFLRIRIRTSRSCTGTWTTPPGFRGRRPSSTRYDFWSPWTALRRTFLFCNKFNC